MTENPSWKASEMFDEAFALARREHRCHARKIDDEPYIGHLLGVSSLIIEHCGSQDQAIAGLLHDLVEDTDTSVEMIEAQFGSDIARLVADCTEATKAEKDSYDHLKKSKLAEERAEYQRLRRDRKQSYLDRLAGKDPGDLSILVALADKVNNAEKTARDLARDPEIFDKFFNAGYADQKWWYQSLVAAFGTKLLGNTPDGKTDPRDRLYERFRVAVDSIFGESPRPTNRKGK